MGELGRRVWREVAIVLDILGWYHSRHARRSAIAEVFRPVAASNMHTLRLSQKVRAQRPEDVQAVGKADKQAGIPIARELEVARELGMHLPVHKQQRSSAIVLLLTVAIRRRIRRGAA